MSHCETMTNTETTTTTECELQSETQQEKHPVQVTRPRVDLIETEDAYWLRADLPGVDESGTQVELEKDVLTLKGESKWHPTEGQESRYTEFGSRRYERRFRLPEAINRDEIVATMKNGVLELKLAKAAEARKAQIAVSRG